MNEFENLVKSLQQHGYTVIVSKTPLYQYARVFGNNIAASFCSKHDSTCEGASYAHVNGKIAADNANCRDNWRKCPLQLGIPTSDEQTNFLMEQLAFWGSEQGYENSKKCRQDTYVYEYPALVK
ncbi:hypothetical protein CN918_29525 [Priestia megaterium]|nr:hypothetical protein CN918_29525 [Priestia megaterium]